MAITLCKVGALPNDHFIRGRGCGGDGVARKLGEGSGEGITMVSSTDALQMQQKRAVRESRKGWTRDRGATGGASARECLIGGNSLIVIGHVQSSMIEKIQLTLKEVLVRGSPIK